MTIKEAIQMAVVAIASAALPLLSWFSNVSAAMLRLTRHKSKLTQRGELYICALQYDAAAMRHMHSSRKYPLVALGYDLF